ncbi:MAG: TonB-dependent receptor [Thermodesulfobacteriota bacterium]
MNERRKSRGLGTALTVTMICQQLAVVLPGMAGEVKEKVQTPQSLPEIAVVADRIITPTMQTGETVATGSRITKKGLEIQGVEAATSVYGGLNLLPGISVERVDANGLAAEMNTIRVRGVRGMLGALTVLGVPNYGGNPIGPREYLYDMENMSGIAVYKGAVPADIGVGVGSRGGALELEPDWPDEETGIRFSQGFGPNDYSRTFFRLDSGRLADEKTSLAASVSYTEADKWRGPGTLGPRRNANLAVGRPLGEAIEIRLWANHNDLDQHLYRPLTFIDISALGDNYEKDYTRSITGQASRDIFYYDYNRGDYRNDDLFAAITFRPDGAWRASIKPYYADEGAEIFQGVAANGGMVQQRNRDIERYGLIGEGVMEGERLTTTIGYHCEGADMKIFTENYAITPTGLASRGYGVFASSGSGYINSPYVKVAGTTDLWDWQAGLKYFHFRDAASKGYVTGPGPDYALMRAGDLDREAVNYDIWLPTLGAARRLGDNVQIHAGYGRGFIRPYSYLPLVSLYNSNRVVFQARGIDLQALFDGYDMEKSDTVDIGLRYDSGRLTTDFTVFYGRHRDLLTSVHDPRVNLNYQQNIGRATAVGAELELNLWLSDSFSFFVNPSYTSLTYDEDLTFAGQRLATAGNQVVDTPEWLVKSGVIWRRGPFEVVPMARYIDNRCADVENRQQVDSFVVVDCRLSCLLPPLPGFRETKLAVEFKNIFDKKYVAVINASDDARQGAATFYPGSPLSAFASLSLLF